MNVRSEKCTMFDKRLEAIIDSAKDEERLEARHKLLISEINDQVVACRRKSGQANAHFILVLGEEELKLLSTINDLVIPDPTTVSFQAMVLWNLKIYKSLLKNYVGVFSYATLEDVFSEDDLCTYSSLDSDEDVRVLKLKYADKIYNIKRWDQFQYIMYKLRSSVRTSI